MLNVLENTDDEMKGDEKMLKNENLLFIRMHVTFTLVGSSRQGNGLDSTS